jgi:hypothetical protein
MLEATVLGHHSLSGHLDRGQLDRLTIGLTEFPSQIWPKGSIYAGKGLLLYLQANTPGDASEGGPWWVLISARSAQELAAVDDAIHTRWDYDSRTKC